MHKKVQILTMERVFTHILFHFVSQEELIANKVVLLPCKKLIVRVSYLLQFFRKFTKMEP